MINYYTIRDFVLYSMTDEEVKNGDSTPLWVDITDPTIEEKKIIAAIFNISISSSNEIAPIKMPSCYYQQKGQVFSKINIVVDEHNMHSISIILTKDQIFTTQLKDFSSSQEYLNYAIQNSNEILTPNAIFSYLIEARINDIEDNLNKTASSLESLSTAIFYQKEKDKLNLKDNIDSLGKYGHILSKHHESLISIRRSLSFLANSQQINSTALELEKFNDLLSQVSLLEEHLSFLSDKINFLLDITFGLIDIEQSAISKVLSIAALIFLPPAIIAGIYGMNFDKIPLLHWNYGFPTSLLIIVISAMLPYSLCKLKRWI